MLNKFRSSPKTLIALSLLWLSVLMLIGGWWIYLMFNMERMLVKMDKISFSKMLFWEGSSFIVLLILLSASLLIFYIKDQRKSKSLQDFFASLTHELKTPLASIKLQGEVISELLDNNNDQQLKNLLTRLTDDTIKLENQMDKILQLSRLERGGELNLTNIPLMPFINRITRSAKNDFNLEISCTNPKIEILADEFALELIFKNLIENSKNHSKSKKIMIDIKEENQKCHISYNDFGHYEGDRKKLSSMFYKHNSSKGSGIGLYLIKKLSEKMDSTFYIAFNPNINFNFSFKLSEDKNA
jgi:signal transduction histidine kinase